MYRIARDTSVTASWTKYLKDVTQNTLVDVMTVKQEDDNSVSIRSKIFAAASNSGCWLIVGSTEGQLEVMGWKDGIVLVSNTLQDVWYAQQLEKCKEYRADYLAKLVTHEFV